MKARKKWARISHFLGREGADAKKLVIFYKALVQAVLLFVSEMWVVTPRIGRTRGGFQRYLALHLTGKQLKRYVDGNWRYSPVSADMAEAGLEEVKTYISHCQITVAHYITTRPIVDLCLETDQHPQVRVYERWW